MSGFQLIGVGTPGAPVARIDETVKQATNLIIDQAGGFGRAKSSNPGAAPARFSKG
jgi:hypothetical protein